MSINKINGLLIQTDYHDTIRTYVKHHTKLDITWNMLEINDASVALSDEEAKALGEYLISIAGTNAPFEDPIKVTAATPEVAKEWDLPLDTTIKDMETQDLTTISSIWEKPPGGKAGQVLKLIDGVWCWTDPTLEDIEAQKLRDIMND